MEKFLKISVFAVGIVCIFIFILSRLDKLPEFLGDSELIEAEESGVYGDLYFYSMVSHFRQTLPVYHDPFLKFPSNASVNDADILVFGDSFFKFARDVKNFSEIIRDSLKMKVYFSENVFPLNELYSKSYKSGKRKILLYEIAERRIFEDFAKQHVLESDSRKKLSSLLKAVIPYDAEFKYQYMLQKVKLISGIYSVIVNLRFNLFGVISELTPVYIENPPWLFLYKTVNNKNTSFYYKYSEDDISRIVSNITGLKNELSEKYNLELVFMPVPNKYTLYHKYLNNDTYNNLLPELKKRLEMNKVSYVDLYADFMSSEKLLYYQTDSHWNGEGINLAFKKFREMYNSVAK